MTRRLQRRRARRAAVGRVAARAGGWSFSAAEVARVLPLTAIGLHGQGQGLADGDTTVNTWAAVLGGLSCTLAAPAATNRPAYSADAVTFDGIDNVLEGSLSKGSAWVDHELGVVGARSSYGSSGDAVIMMHQVGGFIAGVRDESTLAPHYTTTTTKAVGTSDPDGVLAMWSGSDDSAAVEVRRGLTVEATTVPAGATAHSDSLVTVALGGRVATSGYAAWAVRAWWAGVKLTAVQRAYLRALLALRLGVAL